MQKALLTVILALFVVIAAVGFRRALTPEERVAGTTLLADGGEGAPPIPNTF